MKNHIDLTANMCTMGTTKTPIKYASIEGITVDEISDIKVAVVKIE